MTEAESKQQDILRRVRGLMAKASSTEFPEEAKAFQAKADTLMEAYAIETWMLQQGEDEGKAKLIIRRDVDMSWFSDLGNLHWDAKSNVWWLFAACVKHCRAYTSWSVVTYNGSQRIVPVYGLESDLNYLDLLFTDLFTQLFAKIRPRYDANKSLGENVMIAKEAGMKYHEIAVWLGKPEWRESNGSGGWKTCDSGAMLRAYKSHLKSLGKTPKDVITVHPDAYAISYTQAFYHRVAERLREMTAGRGETNTNSMALALRDIGLQAREALYNDFPDMRPHPADCPCKACKARTKMTKFRGGHQHVDTAYAAGGDAGKAARIVTQAEGLRARKGIEEG